MNYKTIIEELNLANNLTELPNLLTYDQFHKVNRIYKSRIKDFRKQKTSEHKKNKAIIYDRFCEIKEYQASTNKEIAEKYQIPLTLVNHIFQCKYNFSLSEEKTYYIIKQL